jgi:Concanavalin A-like lectin/glucanases superfamily/VanZ like family
MSKRGVWRVSPRPAPDGTRGFLTLAILAILAATLKPMQIDEYATSVFCLLCPWDTDDVLANILLFAPLGMALLLRGVGGGRGLMLSTGLSLTVEVAQLWIPGRDSAFTDVASNTLGAAVGIAAAHSRLGDVLSSALSAIARVLTQPEPRLATMFTLGMSVVASVVLILPGVLLMPSFPQRTTYFVGARTLENVRAPLRIGGDTIYGEHVHGVIDEVRIHNRAQTLGEIRRDMSTSVWETLPRADLVAAYGFDEGAGTVVHDTSGQGNPGTISGATWTDQGRFGRALMFDGQRSLVSIPPSPGLDLSAGMTLSAWVYPMSRMTGWRLVISKEINAYFLAASSDAGPLTPAGGGTFGAIPEAVTAPMPIAMNTWGHLALTYDGSTFSLSVNGNRVVCRTRWYPGRVLSISVGDLHLSPGVVFDSSGLRMPLLEGWPLRVYAEATPHPVVRPLPVLRVIDKNHEDILLLSADHEDLRFWVRIRAVSAGFNSPDSVFRRVMRGLSPGEPFTVTLWRDHERRCVNVNGTVTCEPGFTIGTGWTLLCASQYLPAWLQTVLNWFWIAAIVWPIGFWALGRVEVAVAGTFLVMNIWVLPRVAGLAPTPPVEIGVTLVGLLMGAALRLTRDRATL